MALERPPFRGSLIPNNHTTRMLVMPQLSIRLPNSFPQVTNVDCGIKHNPKVN
jgi:hypothetical protein